MNRYDDSTRRRLATGWDTRVSTLRDYARQHSVSERALRNWRKKYSAKEPSPMPERHLDVPAGAAADALLARLAVLDAALDAARAALGAVRAALKGEGAAGGMADEVAPAEGGEEQPAPHAEATSITNEEQPVAVGAPAAPIPKPFPMRRSYFLDFQ